MPRFRSSLKTVFAMVNAAALATACAAQELPPPSQNVQPAPSPASGVGLPPAGALPANAPGLPGQPPYFAAPYGVDPAQNVGPLPMQPNVAPPPYGPAFSPLPPAAVAAGPALGSDPQAGPPGEATGFADLGVRGAEDGFFGGGMHPRDSARYSTIWFPTVPVHGQASDFQMLGEDLSLSHPLWVDPLNALSLTGGIRNRLIDTEAVLPDTGQAIPADLWSVHLGLRYARQLNDGWITGGGVSIGSASDHPFAGIREMDVGMNALLRVPRGEHDAWMFTLMYSPTGELNFPVPGIAYSYNPSPQFHANIGLPLQVVWRPTDAWQFQATYMLLRTVHCKAQYRISQRLRAFAAYDWSNEAYMLLDRPEEDDRFFIYDQRVSMGLETLFFRRWTASASAGYIFDRYMFQGTSFASSSSDRVDLGAGPFLALNIGVRY